jgi:hypothetical protein
MSFIFDIKFIRINRVNLLLRKEFLSPFIENLGYRHLQMGSLFHTIYSNKLSKLKYLIYLNY